MVERSGIVLGCCAIAFAAAYVGLLGSVPLSQPDEARYAEIPREMIERAEFLTPTLNYVPYLEKPPLHYWLTAAAFTLLGESERPQRSGSLVRRSRLGCVSRRRSGGREC